MIQREYDVSTTQRVAHEVLAYERRMQERLVAAQATVDAIKNILERAKERRLQLEVQAIN